jgi:hypothetical protein
MDILGPGEHFFEEEREPRLRRQRHHRIAGSFVFEQPAEELHRGRGRAGNLH